MVATADLAAGLGGGASDQRDVWDEGRCQGYRLIADELLDDGWQVSERRVWRVCSQEGMFSAAHRRKGRRKHRRPGPAVHDDLVNRDFTVDAPNRLWLIDITEHRTSEGKLCLCAVKDMFSGRIVGYSISDRMKARLAVDALTDPVHRCGMPAGMTVHSARGRQGGFNWSHLADGRAADAEFGGERRNVDATASGQLAGDRAIPQEAGDLVDHPPAVSGWSYSMEYPCPTRREAPCRHAYHHQQR